MKCSSLAGVCCLTWQAEPWETPCFEFWVRAWVKLEKHQHLVGWTAPKKAEWLGFFFCWHCAFVQWAHIQKINIFLHYYVIAKWLPRYCYAAKWWMKCDVKRRKSRFHPLRASVKLASAPFWMQVIIEHILNIKPKLSVEKSFIKIICYFKKIYRNWIGKG